MIDPSILHRLADRFPAYRNRTDAVMGYRPQAKSYPH